MSRIISKTLLVCITLLGFSACTATIPAGSEPLASIAGDVQAPIAVPATSANNSFDCASVTEIPVRECQALMAFYEATDGPHWLDSSGWLQTKAPCSWLGVTCTGSNIDTLAVFFNNLQGELPASLADLSQLRVLDLHNNAIGGKIPLEYGRLSSLEYIDLSVNQISGPIPETVGDLSALQSLNLAYNQLGGPIPAALGEASALRNLEFSYNQFNGELPASLADLTALETLRLRDNRLEGEIPFSLSELPALTEIDLTFNYLTGNVPSVLFLAPVHRFWGNQFEGTIFAGEGTPQSVNYLGAAFTFEPAIANSVWPELAPARPAEEGPGLNWVPPEHIVFTLVGTGGPENHSALGLYLPSEAQIHIYPTAGLNMEVQPIVDALQDLMANPSNLDAYAMSSPEGGMSQPALPMLPPSNAVQMFQAQVEPVTFAEGRGVRYLTQLSQGPVPVNNQDLFYTFQGITSDGATYVAASFPVSFSELPGSQQIGEEEMNALMVDWQGYLQQTAGLLNKQPTSAFSPDLAALDTLIGSLSVAGTQPVPAMDLISPKAEEVVNDQPVLQWAPILDAAAYHVVLLDDVAYPPQIMLDQNITEPMLSVETPLAPGHYSVTVWALDGESAVLAEITSTFFVKDRHTN